MTIKITFEGANVQDVLAQMLSVINAPAPPPLDKVAPVVQATPAPPVKRPPGRPPKAASVQNGNGVEPPAAPPPDTAEAEAPDDPNLVIAGPEKSAADIRHDAVLVLKKVYTKGPVGQAKVDEICKHFNVTKLVDIPLDRAVELLQMSNRALFALEH